METAESVRMTPQELEKLFQTLKWSSRKKKWKGISEASRQLGISRSTIYKVLSFYPKGLLLLKPKRVKPQYVQDFPESACMHGI